MDNISFLSRQGITLKGSAPAQNEWINKYYNVNSQDPIIVTCDNEKYELTPDNCEFGFINAVWAQLDVSKRLRIIRWEQINYLADNGYVGEVPNFEFVTEDDVVSNMSDSFVAVAQSDGGLLISLDFVRKSKGLDAFIMIIHECIHYMDFEFSEKIFNKYSDYYSGNLQTNALAVFDCVMALPVEGKIKNLKTGQMEYITPQMREDILLMKNDIVSLTMKKGSPKEKKYADTKEKYKAYLSRMFYYTSPMEYRAYDSSTRYVAKYISQIQHAYPVNFIDKKSISNYHKLLLTIGGRVREIQKHYKMSHYNAVNMELVCAYNEARFEEGKESCICPALMEKREEIVKDLWELKFGYYGKYEPWEKEG